MLSGLANQMTEVHKKRIIRHGGTIEYIKVQTLSFDDIMSNYANITHIDFLSIDVEGAEMSILKVIDFDKYHFSLITVENNEECDGDGERMKQFMLSKGYKVFLDTGLDIIFVPNN